ncbi:hexose-6-phosphate:phosphate antiporter [Loigolactobacillus backii]|uniref:Antiporter n=1 Tax=Loigolactobacillus backii TaxID=375175 RepID=A0A192H288_9LACO|nr:hexose-6-phosphate:phosphate antiporter [Loigolactobacillus backii]ANK60441.1 antiporter [Loigolactobacillus backii]ANK62061.1 antiporter [Loigolactobacillus backii]ANK65320.1 antiporter [Loigolactobacillus backii]ANK68745.1 antiporter [Loigolactobacillus backii]MDA5386749.1 hexose-6-phosphate:phosphate antiporter [Loigolactobacillus backii]
MLRYFDLKRPQKLGLSVAQERKRWFGEFLKSFLVVFFVYFCMYLIRNNLSAAQPLLVKNNGITTTELGWIGYGFSLAYGIGKTLLGYVVDGKNTKKFMSFLLILAALMTMIIGVLLLMNQAPVGLILVLWSLNGLFQSPGGSASLSTISRWTTIKTRGRYIGIWNISHEFGGAVAGIIALWGANHLFGGNVGGMFIFPAIIGLIIGFWGLFYGADDPQELGWDPSEVIFDEKVAVADTTAAKMSKWTIFKTFVMKSPWVWLLCIANVFVYVVRIGIVNWAPLYTVQQLHFTVAQGANTLLLFQLGGIIGSVVWGLVSDLLKGRRAIVSIICLFLTAFVVLGYRYGNTPLLINTSLFFLGMLIYGPQLLIGVSVISFVPKSALNVSDGLTGTFAYIFGDLMAQVGFAAIADPKANGLHLFGQLLHGWDDTFIVFYIALVLSIIVLAVVAVGEERRIRQQLAD